MEKASHAALPLGERSHNEEMHGKNEERTGAAQRLSALA